IKIEHRCHSFFVVSSTTILELPMLFFNIYFLFPMRFCTEIRDERIFYTQIRDEAFSMVNALASLFLGRTIKPERIAKVQRNNRELAKKTQNRQQDFSLCRFCLYRILFLVFDNNITVIS
ncbi:MAG: hypothetical protein PUD22_09835, partial [Erysipelotrichaceae bacterium]|nr:hypothetical protein [Erysipelotrichaceae bacterium]